MKKNKTICLCAIVKDEAEVIERMIKSCISVIDYWVVVDTGSKDNTIKLIKKLLSKVDGELHQKEWVNFGHNRTELVKLAKGKADYLLLADADFEYVIDKNFNKNFLTHNAYHLRYLGDIDFAQLLLVKGDLDWRYIGVTHEYIFTENIGPTPELDNIKIIHYADGGHRFEKTTRDIQLLERAIIDNPADTRNYFYLAQTYSGAQMWDKALKYYTERANKGGWPEEVFYSLYQIGLIQHKLGNTDSAVIQHQEAFSYRPWRFEPLYATGVIFREKKKYHLAKMYFEEVERMVYPERDLLFVHRSIKDYYVQFELAICHYWLENYGVAKKYAEYVKANKNTTESIRKQNEENLKFINDKISFSKSGKNDIIYCSMFTVGTSYEKEVEKLKSGLDKFGLLYELVGLRSSGSWAKNTQMKPGVIKAVMDKYNKDVVWIDADAELKKKPTFFENINADISFYTIAEWKEKLTGTLFFKNNDRVRTFLDSWSALNASNNNPDAENFQHLIEESGSEYKIEPLPPEYIKIFDNDLIKADDPIIVHNQASRRLKDEINSTVNNKAGNMSNTIYDVLKKISDGKNSISIIGNGQFSSDLSEEIEKSFVVRCNNFKVSDKYKGIGQRTDLNISSLYWEIIPTKKVKYPIFGILPISDNLYQEYTDAKEMHRYWAENGGKLINMGNTVWMYSNHDTFADVFKSVCVEINAFPTVGILGVAMARWLGFKKIILTGFAFFRTLKSHYFMDNNTAPSMHHNIDAERDLLRKWILEDSIEYVLDEITKEKLELDAVTQPDTVK